uniref:SRCR domain-containing protein n=1 Tax=Palpitomonas bilix TaxID=652834 RepID=A0A7S3LU83_9EUKA|mmetsp:Transcript_47300/g.122318  ORF Transcript_47300/g.122318 Transcript_47300/m.122318 type:complete len:411 (+) Transcript_47300:492-1724(+)
MHRVFGRVFVLLSLSLSTVLGQSDYTYTAYGGGANCQGQIWASTATGSNYGNVCDDSWDAFDGNAYCQSVSGGLAVEVTTGSAWGTNKIGFLAGDFDCVSGDTSLTSCTMSFSTDTTCSSTRIAGVVCSACSSASNYPRGTARLVGGATPCEGVVQVANEIANESIWGYMKGSAMTAAVATTVCKSLGFTGYSAFSASTISSFSSAVTSVTVYNSYSVTGATCGSTDTHLANCTLQRASENLNSATVASIACTGSSSCSYNSWGGSSYESGGVHDGTTWYAPNTGGLVDLFLPIFMGAFGGFILFILISFYVLNLKKQRKGCFAPKRRPVKKVAPAAISRPQPARAVPSSTAQATPAVRNEAALAVQPTAPNSSGVGAASVVSSTPAYTANGNANEDVGDAGADDDVAVQ